MLRVVQGGTHIGKETSESESMGLLMTNNYLVRTGYTVQMPRMYSYLVQQVLIREILPFNFDINCRGPVPT